MIVEIAADQVYFQEFHVKKIGKFGRVFGKVLILKQSKLMCVFYFHKSSFYFKEQSPKRKFEVNVKKCIPSKWAKLFLTRTKEHTFLLRLFSLLVLKNSMKTFPPGTGLKTFLNEKCIADFRVRVNIF